MAVFEALIVAAIVTASIVFSAWRLSPAKLRLRVLEFFAPRSTNRFVAQLRGKALAELTHGCHACAPSRTPAAPRR
jgi:hypothetical protein